MKVENKKLSVLIDKLVSYTEEIQKELIKYKQALRWIPISEAPKDGTTVLISGFINNDPTKNRWVGSAEFVEGASGNGWASSKEDAMNGSWYFTPTHWMPLPSAPEMESK